MTSSSEDAAKKQPATIVFTKPAVYPGTPEAAEAGCLCSFERNLEAGFLSAEREDVDGVYVVIHEHCTLHKIVPKPMDVI